MLRQKKSLAASASVVALTAAASLCGLSTAHAAAPAAATPAPAAADAPIQAAGGDAQPQTPTASGTDNAPTTVETVVVTGSTSRRTLLDASVAITTTTQNELLQKAPRSTADVLKTIPGIFVEATAGPVSNNYSVRGLPGGGSTFVRLIEDGQPLLYGGFNDDEVLQYDLSYDHVEAIQGGTSGILTQNAAGASINFISRKLNFDEAGGLARFLGATYGEKRGDFWYSAPLPMLGKDVAFAVSGYIDSTPGVRSSPFTYDTYRLKGQLEKKFDDGGFARLTYKRWDEHDPYYADQPYSVTNGDPGGLPGLGTQSGNIIGAGFGSITVPDSCAANECVRTFRELEGIHIQGNLYRIDVEKPIGDTGFTAFAHLRYTQQSLNFNGVFAGSGTGNAGLASAVDYLNGGSGVSPIYAAGVDSLGRFTQVGLTANGVSTLTLFPGATQFGIRSLTTGQVISASNAGALNSLNGNGLLQQTVLNHDFNKLRDYGSDFGVRWNTQGNDWRNSLTVGGMVFYSKRSQDQSGTATVINDVANNSNIYDVVALNNAGSVVGSLSNNGLISYGNWGAGINRNQVQSGSFYFNDEFTFADRLHIDLGLRYEHVRTASRFGNSGPVTDPNQLVPVGTGGIVQVNPNAFNGTYSYAEGTEDPVNWTIGANYTINKALSVYARYADSYQTNGTNPDAVELKLYEAGVTYGGHGLLATVRGFRTEFANQQFGGGVDPDNPNLNLAFFADSNTNGVDVDAVYRPDFAAYPWLHNFSIHGQMTYQDSQFENVSTGATNAGGQTVASMNDDFYTGKTPARTPTWLAVISPQYDLPNNLGFVYARYEYTGSVFVDPGNGLALPEYGVLSLGGVINLTQRLTLNVSVENVSDEIGLTEGNPRNGFTQQVVAGYFYGRGIVGTNAQFSLAYRF